MQDIGVAPQYAQPSPGQPQYAQPQCGQPQYGQPKYAPYQDRPRSGLVTGGLIMILVPYAIGAFASLAGNLRNESGWLMAPVLGPWVAIGQRHYNGCDSSSKSDVSSGLGCTADIFVVMGLVVSGVLQAAGGTLLLLGILNPKPTLVRDDAALKLRPMTIGSGYGFGLQSAF